VILLALPQLHQVAKRQQQSRQSHLPQAVVVQVARKAANRVAEGL
jgi:hypothetical protein